MRSQHGINQLYRAWTYMSQIHAHRFCIEDSVTFRSPIYDQVQNSHKTPESSLQSIDLIGWLPGMDSNHDSRLQRPLSYR